MRSVNLACAECCAMADDLETLRKDASSNAKRIAELGWARIEELSEDLQRARAEIDRINAECNAWSNRAKIAEADLDLTRRNMQRELRDAERENASLRRRLAVGGR